MKASSIIAGAFFAATISMTGVSNANANDFLPTDLQLTTQSTQATFDADPLVQEVRFGGHGGRGFSGGHRGGRGFHSGRSFRGHHGPRFKSKRGFRVQGHVGAYGANRGFGHKKFSRHGKFRR